jgi:tetratricopeptide (TPR) repeat protein
MIEFLGRTEELALLSQAIGSTSERSIVVVSGPGGIGKTRLLQEISRSAKTIRGARVLEIIDFDLPTYEIPQIIDRTIARQFSTAQFAPYLEAIYLRQIAEEGGIDPVRLAAQTLDVNRKFVECFNAATSRERIVLRFDTIEKMQGRASFNRLLDLLFQLNNVVVVFAGRPNGDEGLAGTEALYDELIKRGNGIETLAHMPLQPFDRATFDAYVERKQQLSGTQIEDELLDTFATLAVGRPVLIDLAVELGGQAPAEWLDELSQEPGQLRQLQQSHDPAEQAAFAAIQERFDRELVANVASMRSDLDRLTALLALVAPLDQEHIASILELPPERAADLFNIAASRVSFKVVDGTLIRLHDAVGELVIRYALPAADPEGVLQRRYLTRASEAFEDQSHTILARIGRLRADEEVARGMGQRDQVLALFEERAAHQRRYGQNRLRIVELAFRLDPISGAERLERELEIARQHGGAGADLGAMFSAVQSYFGELERRSPAHAIRAQMLLANQHVADGQYHLADQLYGRLDDRLRDDSALRFDILHGRGNVQMGIGKAQAALQFYRAAAELARRLADDLLLGRALLSSAWAARLLGQLDQAIGYYQQSFGLTIRPDIPHEEAQIRRATAMNGMAYIYAIQGKKSRTAVDSLKQAIDIRQSLGESGRFALGQSYTTAGEIFLSLEQPNEALKYLALADDLFAELNNSTRQGGARNGRQHNQWIAKIASARGRAYRDLAEEAVDAAERHAYLMRAETELEKAVELAIAADLPLARYRLAGIYGSTPDRRQRAVETWQQSMHDAQSFGDIATELFSASQIARMQVYGLKTGFADYHALDEWLRLFRERNPQAALRIAEGRFATYLGCLALRVGAIDDAAMYFQEGLGVLVEQPKQHVFSFDWHLRFLEHDVLPGCRPEAIRAVWGHLLQEWMPQCKGVEAWTTFERWQNWPG